ncbi:hypothetical protein ACHWWK_01670 [Klebsiella pneumoniae]
MDEVENGRAEAGGPRAAGEYVRGLNGQWLRK